MLKQYDEVIPDGANRILQMAEKQSDHRMTLETKVIDSDIARSRWGLAAGFVITIAAIIGGVIVAMNGQPWAGTTIAGIPTAGLVGVFVIGSATRSKERAVKAKLVTGEAEATS